ncbi:MAG TPA: sarcosine oxidase subunit beta family protein [Stellaceae bacterium]|jgi:heterotetrameric sarcosine oxidase beta subunit|nr:sarcosine oxidase subunit beta family protein [Stellaceae bacterium]
MALSYSAFSLARHALTGHRHWPRAWRDPAPKPRYSVIIIGGGGHGLASAYYLAKEHGITDVAVLEKGYLGGGNTGRNTTIIRSNYLLEPNAHFYEFSLKLWEGLSRDLNYNAMVSQRGVINLAHSDSQMDAFARRGNGMRLNGIDAELLDRAAVQRMVPMLDYSDHVRFPIYGGLLQRRGGTARHDAVAWGFARAADRRGVDIIQNCEVTGIRVEQGRVRGVETTRGTILADKVGLAVAGHSSHVAAMAGLRLPIESHVLQAFVSEPLKPFFDTVVTFGVGHFYVSQSDKGELVMGGDIDMYNSYAQRGNLPLVEHTLSAGLAVLPMMSRLRMMRLWGGVMDMTMDGSPIIGKTPIEGLYIDGGWCYGGFKATPASGFVFAHTIAQDRPHPLNEAFTLDRFARGAVIDERGAGPTPNAH